MKIALVAPNSRAHTVTPPLGLGYLAAHVRRGGHDVRIFDLAKEGLDSKRGAAQAAAWEPDLVGVSVLSTAFLQARRFIEEIRRLSPPVKVVVGGAHITAIPESFHELGADLGVLGEAEHTFPEVVDALDQGRSLDGLTGLCRYRDGAVACDERPDFLKDLESLGFPAWDLMPPGSYPDMPNQLLHKAFPVAPIVTSRGCAHDCTFCASTTLWGKRLRRRPATDVVDEIELLVGEYGVREIHFMDDSFTQTASHAEAVCEEILRRGIKTVWACATGVRVDSLSDRLLELMSAAGCYSVGLGLESGSQEVLDRNRKRLNLARVPEQVKMIRAHGIATHGFFIIGLPGETEQTVRETLRFSRSLGLDRANFTLLSPLPGTEIFELRYKNGAREIDYGALNFFTPFPLGDMTTRSLKKWQRRAVLGFYLRPRQVAGVLRDMKMNQVGKVCRAVLDYTVRSGNK